MKKILLVLIIGLAFTSCSKDEVYECECISRLNGTGWTNNDPSVHVKNITADSRSEASTICGNTVNYDPQNVTLNCSLK